MNIRCVARLFGILLLGLSLVMGLVCCWAAWWWCWGDAREGLAAVGLLIAVGVGSVGGGLLWLWGRGAPPQPGRREAVLLVALAWLAGAALAGAPFFVWAHLASPPDPPRTTHPFTSPVNCYFEAMSGLTTTGSTILPKIASVPDSLLLWRSMTQWLGGLGIVVLFVAVLPFLGVGGKRLFRLEAPGPSPEGVRPQIRDTARALWLIYLGLTLAEIVSLRLAGMGWFDAVCHTFTTLATGGFSTTDASIGGFDSVAVELVIVLFMVLAGVNFGVFYQVLHGRARTAWRDPELRAYLAIMAAGSVVVAAGLVGERLLLTTGHAAEASTGTAIRHAVFQVVSLQTTTGYCTADFNLWGFFPKATLVLLMFVGGCGGSTGGGIKVVRLLVMLKALAAEIEQGFRPNVVRPILIGRVGVDAELRQGVLAYILGIVLIFMLGVAALMLLEPEDQINLTTAATAAATTLNNVGPGLGRVGAVETFYWFTAPSKLVMSLLMALGRLEVLAIVALLSPRFWRAS